MGEMKGIILAGGTGTRLYPVTRGCIKQLLPVYDKPLIYYPLSVLMLAGIRDILIITTPQDLSRFSEIFSDGSNLGLNISYAEQPEPKGIAEAFLIGKNFIGNDNVCLILGDNLIYGESLINMLSRSKKTVADERKAVVFGYYVNDPENYGVVKFDDAQRVISIEEKPIEPKSNFAVIGLYFYPNDVVNIAFQIKPSGRGELEITSINQEFLKQQRLFVELLGRGYAWLDTGTHENLLEASNFIQVIEKRQGLKIACIEEIAYKMKYIDKAKLIKSAESCQKTQYGKYLFKIAGQNTFIR